jgi:hypothetical protein
MLSAGSEDRRPEREKLHDYVDKKGFTTESTKDTKKNRAVL